MIVEDRVYGCHDVTEPVLLDLMDSKPMRRLKGINQAGASVYVLPKKTITRYEHGVGTMILSRLMDAPLLEQIKSLLHDAPHTAFSHVIDYAYRSEGHDYHEQFEEDVLLKSDIPKIMKKHGLNVEDILDDSKFKILELDSPDLCADRVDYSLRQLVAENGYSLQIRSYLDGLTIGDGRMVMMDKLTARSYAKDFMKLDKDFWSHPLEVAIFQIMADALKIALDNGIIVHDELFKDDAYVYQKLKKSGNKKVLEKLDMLNPKLKVKDDPDDYEFHSYNKCRFIDPKFLNSVGRLKRVSQEYPDFKRSIEEHKRQILKGSFVKVISW